MIKKIATCTEVLGEPFSESEKLTFDFDIFTTHLYIVNFARLTDTLKILTGALICIK